MYQLPPRYMQILYETQKVQQYELLHNTPQGDNAQKIRTRTTSCIIIIIIIIIKKVRQCKVESDIHPISSKISAPQYQPIDRKKRKGKIVEVYSRDRAA